MICPDAQAHAFLEWLTHAELCNPCTGRGLLLPRGAMTHPVCAARLARQAEHHSPVQRRRNIGHDTTFERGADSTRQDIDRTAGSSMFHLDQPPRITHEANR